MRSARRKRDFMSLDEEALKSSCGRVQSQLMAWSSVSHAKISTYEGPEVKEKVGFHTGLGWVGPGFLI